MFFGNKKFLPLFSSLSFHVIKTCFFMFFSSSLLIHDEIQKGNVDNL